MAHERQILQVGSSEDGRESMYYIHYNGWGPKYDQWVPIESINKDNEINRALMKYKNRNKDSPYKYNSIQEEIVGIWVIRRRS